MNTNFKDSGIAWICQIPKHWEVTKIKYVTKLKTGGTPNNSFGINVENNGYPWITPANIDENFNIKADKFITEESLKISNFSLFYSNTILLIGIGATVGKIGYLLEKSYCNQQITALIPFNINSKFLLYYLHFIKHKIILEASTNTLPIINNKILNNISVIYPPLNEQKEIAEFLDKKCEIIDKRLNNLERKIKSLKEYKKSLISECVTKGLNPKNREFKDSQIPWIGQIPKHWEISKIKYVAKIRSENSSFNAENDKYIGLENVAGYLNSLIETNTEYENSIQAVCKKGDILFGKLRPYLSKVIIASFNCFCSSEFLQFINLKCYFKFFYYFLLNKNFIENVNSSTYGAKMPRANSNYIMNLNFLVPPLNEQKEIAEFLDKKCEKIDRLNENYTKQITTLKEYKKSLIYECVTGKKEI